MAMIAACGLLMMATLRTTPQAENATQAAPKPTIRSRLVWVTLAFVPSAMLVAVTSHISTDIASAPFLWVVPLAIFLATFIFTFRNSGEATHRWLVRLQPFIAAPLVTGLFGGERAFWMVVLGLDLAMLGFTAMICHRELYLKRPNARYLTGFYLWVSLGGVLGGMFAGLIAPAIFPDVWEYPILIVMALLCRPGTFSGGWRSWLVGGAVFAALVALALLPHIMEAKLPSSAQGGWMIGLVLMSAYIMVNAQKPVRMMVATAIVLIVTALYRPGMVNNQTARSFFGVHKVTESVDGRFRMLFHGTTLHGVERLREENGEKVAGKPEPLTYYYTRGPIAETIASMRKQRGKLERVAVVGLGTGSMACHARAGESFRYFEIDPVVVRIASDPSKFRFLSECGGADNIVLGDARLTLPEERQEFDLIVLDAFSSDVVPVHLLTREALSQYLGRLKQGGAIAFHISNRYLELESVIAEVAATHGLTTLVKRDNSVTEQEHRMTMYAGSLVAVVGRSEADLAAVADKPGWRKRAADRGTAPWTDDFSNILAAMWRLKVGH
jgi:hypothetical protein